MTNLAQQYPACRFSLVIGTDLVPTLSRWQHAQDLMRVVHFLVYDRLGYAMPTSLPPHSTLVKHPDGRPPVRTLLSSTRVRDLLKQGRGVDGLVPVRVWGVVYACLCMLVYACGGKWGVGVGVVEFVLTTHAAWQAPLANYIARYKLSEL